MSVALAWALVDGVPRSANAFVGVPPRDRPKATCPCCGEFVVWKAGYEITPYVAHFADSDCRASYEEGAAHYNAKFHFAAMIEQRGAANAFDTTTQCKRGHSVRGVWTAVSGTKAVVEHTLANRRRPDIVVVDEHNNPVYAIEILATCKVDNARAVAYADAGLPWIEVLASVALAWRGVAPVEYNAASRGDDCPACAAIESRPYRAPYTSEELAAAIELLAREFAATPLIVKSCRHHDCKATDRDEWQGVAPGISGTIDGASIVFKGLRRVAAVVVGEASPDPAIGQWWCAVDPYDLVRWRPGEHLHVSRYGFPWECGYCSHSRPADGWRHT